MSDSRADMQQRHEQRHRLRNLALTVFALVIVFGVANQSSKPTIDDGPGNRQIGDDDPSEIDVAHPDQQSASDAVTWKMKADQLAKAGSHLDALHNGRTHGKQAILIDTLVERIDLVSTFLHEHNKVLTEDIDFDAPLAKEIDNLVAQVAQLEQPQSNTETTLPLASNAELLAELDEQARSEDGRLESNVIDDAAVAFAPRRHELQREIARLHYETRDFEEELALIQQKEERAKRQRKKDLARIARQRLLERDLAEVHRLLRPFISPGHEQPNTSAWDRIRTPDARPVSLSGLEEIGALKPTMEGLESLYVFGGLNAPGFGNERPLGDFPNYGAHTLHKPHILEAVKRAQELLRIHGKALVEREMLSL